MTSISLPTKIDECWKTSSTEQRSRNREPNLPPISDYKWLVQTKPSRLSLNRFGSFQTWTKLVPKPFSLNRFIPIRFGSAWAFAKTCSYHSTSLNPELSRVAKLFQNGLMAQIGLEPSRCRLQSLTAIGMDAFPPQFHLIPSHPFHSRPFPW